MSTQTCDRLVPFLSQPISAELFSKTCKTCQQFNSRKNIYGHLTIKNVAELKMWDLVDIELIDQFSKSIIQQHPGGTIIWNNASINCMMMIEPFTGWSITVHTLVFNLNNVMTGNDGYISKPSDRVNQLFNNTWLYRYPRPRKFVVDSVSAFKQDFNPLLKDFNIKPVLTSVKNPQSNVLVEQVKQVILNMLLTRILI